MSADKRRLDPENIPKLSRNQLELFRITTEYETKRQTRAIVHTFVKSIPWIVTVVVAGLAVDDLAGKETRVALLAWFMGLDISIQVSWALTASLSIFATAQHKVFRSQIKRLGEEKRDLEQQVDPGRTTSGLQADGRTQPEDG